MFGWLEKLLAPAPAWRSMDSAPRDGTPIEIRCTYGLEPWTGIATASTHPIDGPIWRFEMKGVTDTNGQPVTGCYTYAEDTTAYRGRYQGANNNHLQWRPKS